MIIVQAKTNRHFYDYEGTNYIRPFDVPSSRNKPFERSFAEPEK